jgi:hypothetical protein
MGNGLNMMASTTEKIAVVAPIPNASDRTAAAVKPGLFRIARNAERTSIHIASSHIITISTHPKSPTDSQAARCLKSNAFSH